MNKTPINDSLQPIVRELIRSAVENACEVVSDMSADDPSFLTIECLRENAVIMLQCQLDEDNNNIRLPAKLKNALNELIDVKVGFSILF